MARRSRNNRAAWIGVLGVTLAAIVTGLFGVWQSNRPKEELRPKSSAQINVGTAGDITVNNTNVIYNQRENESASTNATRTQSEPIKLPIKENAVPDRKETIKPLPLASLPDRIRSTPSITPEPIGKHPGTARFLFYGLSAPEEALLSITLKRDNAVSAVIAVKDGAYAGSKTASIKVAYADGSVYEDSFGVPTNNPGAAVSRQLTKRFERSK